MGKKRSHTPNRSNQSKRTNDGSPSAAVPNEGAPDSELHNNFEDDFEDEFEEEDIVKEGEEVNDDDDDDDVQKQVWRPGVDKLGEDEELQYDSNAYEMYHRLRLEWPCLSFDIVTDQLGVNRTKFPMTAYCVTGTQADEAANNKLLVMKLSEMHKTKHDSDSDDSDDEDDLDDEAVLETRAIPHNGGVNRVRAMPQKPSIVASWADTGKVHMWDVSREIAALETPGSSLLKNTPLFTFTGHPTEGFAMDWSRVTAGRFLSGDCDKHIYLWEPAGDVNAPTWNVDKVPFTGHTSSVEDLQWSPTESTVFASCSSDKTMRIWDTRDSRKKPVFTVEAHTCDVNVISWNPKESHLLASGADDGSFKVWDLRTFPSSQGNPQPAANFKWHNSYVTSIEWCPNDDSVLLVSSTDQVTIWDLAVERDDADAMDIPDVPSQLLFVHMGQHDIKEAHWHPQCPNVVVSTADDSFNVFKPSFGEA